MEATTDLDTSFYFHTPEFGGDGCLWLLAPNALTFLEIVRAKMVPSIWLRTMNLPSDVPVDGPPSLGNVDVLKARSCCAILRRGNDRVRIPSITDVEAPRTSDYFIA
jgi:hypothetical protein